MSVARFADAASADALVALLAAHRIAAHVEGVDPLSIGLGGRVRVVIEEGDVRRARRVIDDAERGAGDAASSTEATPDPVNSARRKSAPTVRTRSSAALRVAAVLAAVLLIGAALAR